MQQTMADQHWLAIGTENSGTASNVDRVVRDGKLFKVVVNIATRQKIGLIDLGASLLYEPRVVGLTRLLADSLFNIFTSNHVRAAHPTLHLIRIQSRMQYI